MASTAVDMICVVCPKGCTLHVCADGEGSVRVEGNGCARGIDYARTEVSNPTRQLSLALCVPGAIEPVSVKTSQPIPKGHLLDAAKAAYAAQGSIHLPVHVGDVVVPDICGTGADLVATKSVPL